MTGATRADADGNRRRRWAFALAVLLLPTLGMLGGLQLLRWHAMGEPERTALRQMQPEPLPGENGHGFLLMSAYEIAPDAVPAAMRTELEDFSRWRALQSRRPARRAAGETQPKPRPFILRVAGGHKARPHLTMGAESPLCRPLAPGCMAHVRARLDAVRELMLREAPRMAMLERGLAADHLDEPVYDGFPKIRYQALALLPTRAALDAVEGRPALAAERACGFLADARRLLPRSRGLITNAILRTHTVGAAALLLDIRRENPGLVLPASCELALAPMQPAELALCPALRTEFAIERDLRRRLVARAAPRSFAMAGIKAHFIENEALEDAWLARIFAAYCDDPAPAAFLAGQWLPPQPPPAPVELRSLSCFAALGPCARANDGPPGFWQFTRQVIETSAKLQLLLAAHAAADGGPREPPAIPGYPVSHDPAAGTWTINLLLSKPANETFSLTLPDRAPELPGRKST